MSRSTAREESDSDEEPRLGKKRARTEEDEMRSVAPPLRHKVTTKGERIPLESSTFEEMEQRFKIASHVMNNVFSCGYTEPTAIQRVGVPILAEVSAKPLSNLL